jgi:ornithine cyclodeaminase
VQGLSHLEAFHQGLGVQEVWIASRSAASADALVGHAERLGLKARRVDDPNAALAECPLVITTTPAQQVVMTARPRDDAFVSAVGAFTPRMVEWSADVCQHLAHTGTLVVDTRDADHEAGDLLQAGVNVELLPTLRDVVCQTEAWQTAAQRRLEHGGPVFFKSCGWAGWDLAAARCVAAQLSR